MCGTSRSRGPGWRSADRVQIWRASFVALPVVLVFLIRICSIVLPIHEAWLIEHRARVSSKSPLGEALKNIAKYWDGLCLFLTDGRIEMDANAVERTIRPIALNRKNALFAGHDVGAENWGVIASLIETCKLNTVDPHAYPSDFI